MNEISLSVIVPVLNEAPGLVDLHERLRSALPEETEIIYVDDGSQDSSPEILQGIASSDPMTHALRLSRHLGKSCALEAGFSRARGKWIATIDADLQESPREITRFLETLREEGYDLVVGWRRRRRDDSSRVLASRLFNQLVRLLGGVKLKDINCGLKVMRREVVEQVTLASGFHRFIPLLAHWKGFRVVELEVEHQPRTHGRSRYGGERFFHGVVDLTVVLLLLRSEERPSRYFILFGMLLTLAGSAIALFIVYVWLSSTPHTIQSRHPLMAFGLLFLVAGLQIFTLGFFAELIAYHFRSGRRPVPAFEVLAPPGGEEEVKH